MVEWVRRYSLVRRVGVGFGVLVALCAALLALALQSLPAGPAARLIAALALGGLVFGSAAGLLIASSVRATIEPTVQSVIRIAQGDLETKVESPGRDEIAWLRGELNGMRKKLRGIVLEVRGNVDGVATASREIASGNGDLSARTERQAAALEQTASAMAGLADSVRGNARATAEARSLAQASGEIATRGSQATQQMTARMAEIHASAARIAEIIGVI
ncbi:HAMP domain-containing protein, partial [Piscinibacter sakaiensis]